MPELFGHTRARIAARHALITPENHVPSSVPGVSRARAVALISPAMGAGFAQVLLTFEANGSASAPAGDLETFGYVMNGSVRARVGDQAKKLAVGGYFYSPAGLAWSLESPAVDTQVTLFQKKYAPLHVATRPAAVLGDASKVAGSPFLGDPAANLQVLLPDEPAFDMAVNVFSYVPGGHLPCVEVHIMEHGLIMLDGQGVYRLEDSWYPVRKGDAIWMAPYCAQWFVAMGKEPARYLYYKDVNRSPL